MPLLIRIPQFLKIHIQFLTFPTRASPLTKWRGTQKDMERSNRRAAPLSLRPTCTHRARIILSKTLMRSKPTGQHQQLAKIKFVHDAQLPNTIRPVEAKYTASSVNRARTVVGGGGRVRPWLLWGSFRQLSGCEFRPAMGLLEIRTGLAGVFSGELFSVPARSACRRN